MVLGKTVVKHGQGTVGRCKQLSMQPCCQVPELLLCDHRSGKIVGTLARDHKFPFSGSL